MTNQQILEKAIQKAIDGGWKDYSEPPVFPIQAVTDGGRVFIDTARNEWNVWQIIFDHDFAKALWGSFNDDIADGMPQLTFQKGGKQPALLDKWQYRLQQMVISPNPIEYLGENL